MHSEQMMSEADLMDAVVELAHLRGFIVAHFAAARVKDGWRTPARYDAKGFPDLTIVGHGRFIVAELKSARGKLDLDQHSWLDAMRDTPVEVHLWRPVHWFDGTIDAALCDHRMESLQ